MPRVNTDRMKHGFEFKIQSEWDFRRFTLIVGRVWRSSRVSTRLAIFSFLTEGWTTTETSRQDWTPEAMMFRILLSYSKRLRDGEKTASRLWLGTGPSHCGRRAIELST